jgi:hypothetical protein
MRIDALDNFAVKLKHKAQYAVRRRMLRTEIDREVAFGAGAHVPCPPLPGFAAFSSPGNT